MGGGSRYSLKIKKENETTPGPGMYPNINPHSILNSVARSKSSAMKNEVLAFGCSKEQSNKLVDYGQERVFLGK